MASWLMLSFKMEYHTIKLIICVINNNKIKTHGYFFNP